MGASEGSEGGIGLECTVGTIVWVRRRNGSWWPGRILSQEELLASHLVSPRSGTPIKLLGREDASVDWYNLEKSKRVKAFRCGEFDGCIERAVASQGYPIKKREKYARREDAILHALELEKMQIQLKQQKLGILSTSACEERSETSDKSLNFSLMTDLCIKIDDSKRNSKLMSDKSHMISRKGSSPNNGENLIDSLYGRSVENSMSTVMEDSTATMPRMRGIQDFGRQINSSKQKLSHSLAAVTSMKDDDTHMVVVSGSRTCLDMGKNFLPPRKGRSLSGTTEETLGKRRNRRRPLMKVLKNNGKLLDSIPHRTDVGVGFSMDGENDNVGIVYRAKRSRVYLSVDTCNLLDDSGVGSGCVRFSVPECEIESLGEEFTTVELLESNQVDVTEIDFLEPNLKEDESSLEDKDTKHDPPAAQVIENYGHLNDDMYAENGGTQFDSMKPGLETSAEVGVSKWHMKGKRKSRNLGKRPPDAMGGENRGIVEHNSSILVQENIIGNGDGNCFKMDISSSSGPREQIFCPKGALGASCSEEELLDNDMGKPSVSDNNGYSFQLGDLEGSHSNQNDLETDSHFVASLGSEADGWFAGQKDKSPSPVCIDCPSRKVERGFIDVELKIREGTYHGEHVPLVSLMSRFNGKAIIGHPIQIEIMEDGSTRLLISLSTTNRRATSPPVWSTGRRTAMQRVPRSNPDPTGPEVLESPEVEEAHVSRTPSGRFPKKGNFSNQKIRTLSSIGTRNSNSCENGDTRLGRTGHVLGRSIESGGISPPITCVPMKVVFIRIMEAVGRPSSMSRRTRVVL